MVLSMAGGGTDNNIKRWKDQFVPPARKKIDDVAKVTKIKIGTKEATLLDVTGTYVEPASKVQRAKRISHDGHQFRRHSSPTRSA